MWCRRGEILSFGKKYCILNRFNVLSQERGVVIIKSITNIRCRAWFSVVIVPIHANCLKMSLSHPWAVQLNSGGAVCSLFQVWKQQGRGVRWEGGICSVHLGHTRDPFLSLSESLSFPWPHLSFISRLCDAAPARITEHTPKADSRGAAASTGQRQKCWVDAERFYVWSRFHLNLQLLCSSLSFPSCFFLPILLFVASPLLPAHPAFWIISSHPCPLIFGAWHLHWACCCFLSVGSAQSQMRPKDSDLSISPPQNLIPMLKQSVLCKIWAFRLRIWSTAHFFSLIQWFSFFHSVVLMWDRGEEIENLPQALINRISEIDLVGCPLVRM